MKTILVTSTDLMMVQFLLPHIENLHANGYAVDIACSNVGDRIQEIKTKLGDTIRNFYLVNLHRSPFKISNIKGYKQLKEIISSNHYDLIWTNEPVMGVATRLAARKQRKSGTLVLYMAHGFHFFRGAPLINWMLYYPIERIMAHCTDVICTVNKEDYQRCKQFSSKYHEFIHGIGINTSRLSSPNSRHNIRKELSLGPTTIIVLSVGELNKNKNHKTIIKALSLLKDTNIHYIICGKGAELDNLKALSAQLGVECQVHFLGYRTDVVDICSQATMYAMPSFREGLPVSSLEAMYCGLPLITSSARGLCDVNQHNINGFVCAPNDYFSFSKYIVALAHDPSLCEKMANQNKKDVEKYTISKIKLEILHLITKYISF